MKKCPCTVCAVQGHFVLMMPVRNLLYLFGICVIILHIIGSCSAKFIEKFIDCFFETQEKEKIMSAFFAIILGIVQGITEFLPVSSFGHVAVLEKYWGISRGCGALFEAMLHLGTLFAVYMAFRKDIRRVCVEFLGIIADLIGNLNLYIHNRRSEEQLHYAKVITSSYRRFAVLIMISMIPTAAIGYICRRLVVRSALSSLVAGIGMLITGIILLVTDMGKAGGTRSAREVSYDHAMWLGICQGISVFPGFSRSGLTICMALLFGFSRTYAVKFSYIMSIPAVAGAFFMELGEFTSPSMSLELGFDFVLGMLASAVTGYFCARFLLRLVHRMKFRYFAYYCFLAGMIALAGSYLV